MISFFLWTYYFYCEYRYKILNFIFIGSLWSTISNLYSLIIISYCLCLYYGTWYTNVGPLGAIYRVLPLSYFVSIFCSTYWEISSILSSRIWSSVMPNLLFSPSDEIFILSTAVFNFQDPLVVLWSFHFSWWPVLLFVFLKCTYPLKLLA